MRFWTRVRLLRSESGASLSDVSGGAGHRHEKRKLKLFSFELKPTGTAKHSPKLSVCPLPLDCVSHHKELAGNIILYLVRLEMSKPRPISFITTFLDSSGSSPAEKGATTASLHDAECMSARMSQQAHVEPFAFTGIENSGIPKLKKKVSSHASHLHDASLLQVSPVSSVKAPYQQIL